MCIRTRKRQLFNRVFFLRDQAEEMFMNVMSCNSRCSFLKNPFWHNLCQQAISVSKVRETDPLEKDSL